MTQEDKELLLKDLSGRLPYGVFCVGTTYELDDDGERYIPVEVKDTLTEIHNYKLETAFVRLGLVSSCKLETVKPYLRPMSSITEEEKEKIKNISDAEEVTSDSICYLEGDTLEDYMSEIPFILCYNIIAWLLENHFDFMGLIPKGLAVEATPENNPYKDV